LDVHVTQRPIPAQLSRLRTAMRFHLRTLLIVLALGPPALAWYVWPAVRAQYVAWQWREAVEAAERVTTHSGGLIGQDKPPVN
jgi:hypothetical protein